MCKDTVASLSDPVQHNSYGQSEGAWMRDARGHGNVIYLTNGHYGDELKEFRDMDAFKTGLKAVCVCVQYVGVAACLWLCLCMSGRKINPQPISNQAKPVSLDSSTFLILQKHWPLVM